LYDEYDAFLLYKWLNKVGLGDMEINEFEEVGASIIKSSTNK